MQYRSVKGLNGASQLAILLIFLGAGFVLASAIYYLIGLQLIPSGLPTDSIIPEINKALTDPKNVGYARINQILGT